MLRFFQLRTESRPVARIRPWHTLPSERLLEALGSRPTGLLDSEAQERLRESGPNVLMERRPRSPWRLILKQFQSPLIYVLLMAATLSFFFGERFDPYVILGVLALNAGIGFFQERRAEHAISALKRLTAPHAGVLREGHQKVVEASLVVVGDVLVLQAGDRVAADARLLHASELHLDESALTGESLPVLKITSPLEEADLPLADRTNMVYMSTVVTGGRGQALVVATGMASEIGRIAQDVATVASVSPLQRKFEDFGRRLGISILIVIVGVLALGVLKGLELKTVFALGISMAVSAIPEGLPVIVSMLLSIGVWRMARRNALIRNLPAVESLGSATVICTDKTGTLTQNQMTVRRLFLAGQRWAVEGEGYRPQGLLIPEAPGPVAEGVLREFAAGAALCNDAAIEEVEGFWQVVGDPTEGALQTLALKAGFRESWSRVDEIPFSSERKWMATLHERPDGQRQGFIKGALEALLELACDELDEQGRVRPLERERWHQAFDEMASQALRVLAIGKFAPDPATGLESMCHGRVTLLGLAGMIDPPRPDAIEAVHTCQSAGIRVVMLTGDHLSTAMSIARQLGILTHAGLAMDGKQFAALAEKELDRQIRRLQVLARVSPEHKLRIVKALQQHGEIVAMTGDGVNDAPALAQADMGVAMGRSGTEVAKEAADMVLTDDRFATIVAAVHEGRAILETLHKAILYLVSTSLGEILTIASAVAIGLPLPFHPVQILWINLVTDGVLDQTYAFEEGEPGLMTRRPSSPRQPLITRPMAIRASIFAAIMAGGTLGLYAWVLAGGMPLDRAQTMAFVTIVAFQWFSAFTLRSFDRPLLQQGPFSNPWMVGGLVIAVLLQGAVLYLPPMQVVFRTVPLSPWELGSAMAVASILLAFHEGWKVWRQHHDPRA